MNILSPELEQGLYSLTSFYLYAHTRFIRSDRRISFYHAHIIAHKNGSG